MTAAVWGPPPYIRVLAVGIVRDGDRILVFEGTDPSKPGCFYRPIGGAVQFGEHAEDALRREFREELGVDLADIHYVATLENLFVYNGRPGHEYVRVYAARLMGSTAPEIGREEDGTPFKVLWLELDRARRGEAVLYPAGLLVALEPDSTDG